MERIQTTAVFPAIAGTDLAELKQVVGELVERARQEPGTLQYDWFFNADETQCFVRETFADSSAALAHMANASDLLPRLLALGGGVKLELFGNASDELRAALAPFESPIYAYALGK